MSDDKSPAGYLFPNGNAVFFDAAGEQIPDFQRHGLSGVHPFRERYPDAPIYWSLEWPIADTNPIHEHVVDHIKHPDDRED